MNLRLSGCGTLTSIPGIGRVVLVAPTFLSWPNTTHRLPSNFVFMLSRIILNSSVFPLIRHNSFSLSTLVSSGLCKNIMVKLQKITCETHETLLK